MPSRSIPITDHRGRPFTLWPQALLPLPESDPESRLHARSARRIVWQNFDANAKTRIRWLIFGAVALTLGAILELFLARGRSPRIPQLFWAMYFGFAIFRVWREAITARSTSICQDLLSRSLCPACGYNLSGLAPDPDNCTTCPECGAAWRVPHTP